MLSVEPRNVPRLLFRDARVRAAQPDWEPAARIVVATFRAEVARTGTSKHAQGLIQELSRQSPESAAMWRDHDVRTYGKRTKFIQPAQGERIALECSSFAVDGQPKLGMGVDTPAEPADAAQVRASIARRRAVTAPQARRPPFGPDARFPPRFSARADRPFRTRRLAKNPSADAK